MFMVRPVRYCFQTRYRSDARRMLGVFIVAMLLGGFSHAADSESNMTIDTVRKKTKIPWTRVHKEQSGQINVVRRLSRSYPGGRGQKGADEEGEGRAAINQSRAEQLARQFLLGNSDILVGEEGGGVLSTNNLCLKNVILNKYPAEYAQRGTDFTVVLGQVYKGIPVFEAECRISLTQFGEIWTVKNSFSPIRNASTSAVITTVAALHKAKQELNDKEAEPQEDPVLMVLAPSQLVWRMNFLQPHFKEILIDASTGEIALMRGNVRDAPRRKASGTGQRSGSKTILPTERPVLADRRQAKKTLVRIVTEESAPVRYREAVVSAQGEKESKAVEKEATPERKQDKIGGEGEGKVE